MKYTHEVTNICTTTFNYTVSVETLSRAYATNCFNSSIHLIAR